MLPKEIEKLIKAAAGAGPGLSSHAPWSATTSASAPPTGAGTVKSLSDGLWHGGKQLGQSAWNNGGKQLAQGAWNNGGKQIWNNGGRQVWRTAGIPAVNTLGNTFHGISTTGVGAANAAAGGLGALGGGVGYLGAGLTDATGLTNGAQRWVGDNIMSPTTRALGAGAADMLGGAADTLSGGNYDYDGTFASPGQHAGTYVEQLRSNLRDQLGRGSDLDGVFNTTNAVADFAANQAAIGGAGRGMNVAAKTLQGSQTAAPILQTVSQAPVVGKPLASGGRWLAGEAPVANMFQNTPAQYYRNLGSPLALGDDVFNAGSAYASAANPYDRPQEAREYQNAQTLAPSENYYGDIPRGVLADQPPATAQTVSQAATDNALSNMNIRSSLGQPLGLGNNPVPQVAPPGLGNNPRLPVSNAAAPAANAQSASLGAQPSPTTTAAPSATSSTTTQAQPDAVAVDTTAPAPATPQPQTAEPAKQTTAAPAQKRVPQEFADHTEAAKILGNPQASQEQREDATKYLTQHLLASGNVKNEDLVGAKDLFDGNKTPEAQRFQSGALQKFLQESQQKAQQENPQGFAAAMQQGPQAFGDFMAGVQSNAMQMWNNLDPMAQMAVGFGVPTALIGLMGGGGLSMLLGGLGIGALGIGAAGMGMFGDKTQANVSRLAGDAMNFFGLIPDEARDINSLRPDSPQARELETNIEQTLKTQGPEAAQKLIDAQAAKADQLRQLNNFNPQLAEGFVRGMHGFQDSDNPRALIDSALSRADAAKDPNFLRNQFLAKAQERVKQDPRYMAAQALPAWMRVGASLGMNYLPQGIRDKIPENVQTGVRYMGMSPQQIADEKAREFGLLPKKAADYSVAQKIAVQHMAMKAARCWAGYEPVPGKAPYTDGSCRPKNTKKKKTEKKSADFSGHPEFDRAATQKVLEQFGYKLPSGASDMDVWNLAKRRGTYGPKQTPNNLQMALGSIYGGKLPKPPVTASVQKNQTPGVPQQFPQPRTLASPVLPATQQPPAPLPQPTQPRPIPQQPARPPARPSMTQMSQRPPQPAVNSVATLPPNFPPYRSQNPAQ